MRHLTEQQAAAALRRGTAIEQLLSTSLDAGTVVWLSLAPTGDGIALRRHEVVDDGSDDFFDVYEFRPTDHDQSTGEGTVLTFVPDIPGAFEAARAAGARSGQWVNAGVIQDEYADLSRRRT